MYIHHVYIWLCVQNGVAQNPPVDLSTRTLPYWGFIPCFNPPGLEPIHRDPAPGTTFCRVVHHRCRIDMNTDYDWIDEKHSETCCLTSKNALWQSSKFVAVTCCHIPLTHKLTATHCNSPFDCCCLGICLAPEDVVLGKGATEATTSGGKPQEASHGQPWSLLLFVFVFVEICSSYEYIYIYVYIYTFLCISCCCRYRWESEEQDIQN